MDRCNRSVGIVRAKLRSEHAGVVPSNCRNDHSSDQAAGGRHISSISVTPARTACFPWKEERFEHAQLPSPDRHYLALKDVPYIAQQGALLSGPCWLTKGFCKQVGEYP